MRNIIGIANAIAISLGVCGPVQASEVKLLSALVMKPAITELAAEFERASGLKLTVTYDSAGAVKSRIQSGEPADVTIVQKLTVEALIKEGKIAFGSNVILARSGVGAAVPRGALKPDISTVDALKRALIAAKSIAYPVPDTGHASGIHFRGVIERLGITKEVNAKAKFIEGTVADFASHDSADIVISQPMEILATPSYELVGWLPSELQDYEGFTWSVGITANANELGAAKVLVQFLVSPTAATVIKAKGMEPVGK